MMHKHSPLARTLALSGLIAACMFAGEASADERMELEQLRATTMSLIEALVDSGVLPRDKADKLIADAEARARKQMAEKGATGELGKDGRKIVRVAYVPESMKQEIREQVKQEVLAQAKTERWGEPGALPAWMDRFEFQGDLRMRYDAFSLGKNNTQSGGGLNNSGNLTRGADLVVANGTVSGTPNVDTQDDYNRWRLRARFGANVKIADWVSGGFLIATGSTSGPTSTNQTLGQNFNKYSIQLDRGFLTLKPTDWLSLTGGRIANPYLSTDLVWADDLNFEGVAISATPHFSPTLGAFATLGWFPLRADVPLQTSSRSLAGFQAGVKELQSSVAAQVGEDLRRAMNQGPGPIVADAMRARTGAQIALSNPGGIRTDLPQGPLTVAQVYEVIPFGNSLVLLKMKGDAVVKAIEDGVDFSLREGKPPANPLLYVSGIAFDVDPARPFGARVTHAQVLDGTSRPLDPAATYSVVVNSFMAAGGDHNATLKAAPDPVDTGLIDAEALLDYVKDKTLLNAGARIHLLP